MIDFHCHLDLYPNPVEIAERCVAEGVYVLSVTTAPSAWSMSQKLLERKGRIRVSLGLHPQIAHERSSEIGIFESHIGATKYVGEIGLDGGPEYREHRQVQSQVFSRLLQICEGAGGRIISLHSRHAAAAVLDALQLHRKVGIPILHWFSGSALEMKHAIDLDCWFSVGPAMLASDRGRALALRMPKDRVLTETDGPFARIQDETLYPWHAQDAVESLSHIWNMPLMEVEAQLRDNLAKIARAL